MLFAEDPRRGYSDSLDQDKHSGDGNGSGSGTLRMGVQGVETVNDFASHWHRQLDLDPGEARTACSS